MPRRHRTALAAAALLALSACDRPLDDPSSSAAPSCQRFSQFAIPQNYANKVDILFVVENSPAMAALSPSVAEHAEQMMKPIFDLMEKGTYGDLHVGVITTDRGHGPRGNATCLPAADAPPPLLVQRGEAAAPDCQGPVFENWIRFYGRPGNPFPDNLPPGQSLGKTLSCMLAVGSNGCDAPQPLEAAYQALRDKRNAGFLRDDALLVLAFIGAQDDQSVTPDDDALYPTERYTNWLQFNRLAGGLKDSPIDVVMVTISGPEKLPPPPGPSCSLGAFQAWPAPRIEEVAGRAKQHESHSICEADWNWVLAPAFQLVVCNCGFGCIRYPLSEPLDRSCRAVDVTLHADGRETRTELPYCGEGVPLPCFVVEPKIQCGNGISPQGVGLTVRRDWSGPPPHTATVFDCIGPCGDVP